MEEKNQNNNSDPQELDVCKKERDEYLEGWKRAKADFINYKKDEARRIEDTIKFSNEAILREIISVLDSFHIAIQSHGDAKETKGLSIILGQLEEALKRFGLQVMSISPGTPYDPSTQEAIQEVDSPKPPGTIHEEITKGYTLYGKVIRPARVVISKSKK